MRSIMVAPSLLSADFSRLAEEIRSVEAAGAQMLHVDVMDGHFVPNLTIGPLVVASIRTVTALPLDVHLMIERPLQFVDSFIAAGSDRITLHIETVSVQEFRAEALRLRKKNIKIGISLNPATALEDITPVLDCADIVLVMTVVPGFGGQQFMAEVVPKIKALRALFKGEIAVDGGISDTTAGAVIGAGADTLAAGSYIFGAADRKKAIERIRNARGY